MAVDTKCCALCAEDSGQRDTNLSLWSHTPTLATRVSVHSGLHLGQSCVC